MYSFFLLQSQILYKETKLPMQLLQPKPGAVLYLSKQIDKMKQSDIKIANH